MSTTFFDNTTQANNIGTQVGIFASRPFNSFTIPNSSPAWKLTSVQFKLVSPGFTGINTFDCNLYNDNGSNSPGTLNTKLVVAFNVNLVSNVVTLVDISSVMTIPASLAPGRYWIELEDPLNTGVNWQDPNTNLGAQGTGVAGEYNGEFGVPAFVALNNNVNSPAAQMLVTGDPAGGISKTRYGVNVFLQPQPANSVPYRLCVNNNRLHCILPDYTGIFSDYVYYLGRENNQGGYWYRYVIDPAALFSEEDGNLYGGFGDAGLGNLFSLDVANISQFAGSNISIDTIFPMSKNEVNQRKDVYHLRFHIDTGNLPLTLTGYTDFGAGTAFALGTITTNGVQEFNLLIQNSNFNLAKRMALRIAGATSYFKLIDWSLDYEARPEPVSYLRIATNYGLAAKKRLRTIPLVIDTRGAAVNVNVTVDGVAYGNQSFTNSERTTVFYYFNTDVFATDIIINITAITGNTFEYYEAPTPVNVEVLPVGKLFDQIGPVELERIGALLEFRVRMMATTNTLTYNVFMDDVAVVSAQTLAVTPNVDKTYGPFKMPKGIQGSVCRVEFLSSNGVFYRWNCKLKFTTGGTKSDTKQITIQDKNVGLQS